jgi:hypothetical protein
MFPPIFSWLSSDSTVSGLLSSGGTVRIFRDEITQGTTFPALCWFLVAGQPENYLGERPGIETSRLQFDIYAPTQAQAEAIYEAVRDVLEVHGHIVNFNGSGREPATRQYFVSFDFAAWQNRA